MTATHFLSIYVEELLAHHFIQTAISRFKIESRKVGVEHGLGWPAINLGPVQINDVNLLLFVYQKVGSGEIIMYDSPVVHPGNAHCQIGDYHQFMVFSSGGIQQKVTQDLMGVYG